jgi:hypothetical protein
LIVRNAIPRELPAVHPLGVARGGSKLV